MADQHHNQGNHSNHGNKGQEKLLEKAKEPIMLMAEGEGRSISTPLIIVIVLVIIGGFYLMKNKEAEAPTEEVVAPVLVDPVPVENPLAGERTSKVLANGLGIDPELISIVSLTEHEWSDGCLGLGRPEEGCIQAITPGYEVVLEAQNVRYTYRTDTAVNQIRLDRSMIGK